MLSEMRQTLHVLEFVLTTGAVPTNALSKLFADRPAATAQLTELNVIQAFQVWICYDPQHLRHSAGKMTRSEKEKH